jgi:acyl carrier protein
MGLDTVELAMEIEEEFRIGIPDKDGQEMRTVGELINFVQLRLRCERPTACRSSTMFYRIRRELLQHLCLRRHDAFPSASLGTLVPRRHRRRVWEELLKAGLRVPELRRPFAVGVQLGSASLLRDLVLYNIPPSKYIGPTVRAVGDSQIARRVREIVSAQTGVGLDNINDDTRFIEDLGME